MQKIKAGISAKKIREYYIPGLKNKEANKSINLIERESCFVYQKDSDENKHNQTLTNIEKYLRANVRTKRQKIFLFIFQTTLYWAT